MLRVEQIAVAYGAIDALHGISLEVGQGEVVALLGANGAGKTTLLRTISGLHRAKSGAEPDGRMFGVELGQDADEGLLHPEQLAGDETAQLVAPRPVVHGSRPNRLRDRARGLAEQHLGDGVADQAVESIGPGQAKHEEQPQPLMRPNGAVEVDQQLLAGEECKLHGPH